MKISGFTMGRNVSKLYYPMKESILSILPIVDEFVVALGASDDDDNTREQIESIASSKIRIIDTVWDLEKYPNGMENAHQTDIAMKACKGHWLFYLQADEVVHEKYLSTIVEACEKYLDNPQIEGLLFKYRHFYGDYDHYINSHSWYPREIRIVRNLPDIHSWQSAQSFRRIPDFDGLNYRQWNNTYKLAVAEIDAYIYHYGWVRPPEYMQKKTKALDTIHKGSKAETLHEHSAASFDYGPIRNLPVHKGTHPEVMREMIARFHWKDQLDYKRNYKPKRRLMKHERLKYRLLTFIEQNLLGGRQLFGYSNWKILN